MYRIIIFLLSVISFLPAYSQSTKERLIMVMEQNRYLNEKLKGLSEKMETQEKTIWNLENKIKSIESKLNELESSTNRNAENKQIVKPTNNITNEKSQNSTKPENNNEQPRSFGQCKAITAKGTQCSRQGGATGYCWQHNK